ncbi:type I restriction enzyme, S subunit [Oscillibacter sp. PC13]|uniref:restriction endonuclease subunit S n=1 Tax=Oscillibacter sp. PC13 TaxID=1855299 RepID=UPI0008E86905|nr:restriction endonuclease subunit S [Oscillibacter sp. PC13]SFP37788.1 type I restriction enzyme, S subunit [Oscillibacter sp. PC13]
MQRYSEYTAAPAAWLGDLPSHWDVKKIGSLFSERKTKVSDKDYPPLSVAKVGVVPQLATAVKTDAGDNRKLVCAGDFVINSRSDRKGSCGVSELDGSVSLINIVLTPRDQWNGRYVHYLMRSQPFSEEYYRNGRGIVSDLWTTRYSEMKSILLPIPPRDEQDQIVRFLDWKAATINKLINLKKKQICIYEEVKKGIIASLVIHGLNDSIPMKDSGSQWLGSIPDSWKCLRGKYLFREIDQRSLTGEEELLTVSHITGITPRREKNVTMFKSESLIGYKICKPGQIAANTMWMWQGAIAVSNYDGVISPSYNTYEQINNDYIPEYLDLLLRSKPLVDNYVVLSTGIRKSRLRLYPEQFLTILFPVPPLEDQQKIVASVSDRTAQIQDLVSVIQQEISELQEFKSRLVADVVTGKIDVRNIQILLM